MVFKLKRQAKRFIPISSKQPGKFWAKFPEYSLRLELVQDSEETLTMSPTLVTKNRHYYVILG